MTTTFDRIQLNRKTAAQWTAGNIVLLPGEAGVETDTHKVKVGDGSTAWTGLPYVGDAATAGVSTVNGRTGTVTLTAADVGLGNVTNTSDANKPVSTAQATALAGKADYPAGGVNGQALVKNGTTTGWASMPTGGGGSTFEVYAPAPLGGTAKDDANILATITGNPGKTVYLRPGSVYLIDSLRLPSGSTLDLNGSELRQNNPTGTGGGGACVRNATMSDTVTSNSDIWVRNGRIATGTASSARPVSFQGVTRLKLTDLTVEKRPDATFSDFMLSLRCVDDVVVDRVKVTGGTALGEDGIHTGGITRARISNVVVDAGDDALCIVHQFGMGRASSQVTVSNAVLRSTIAHAFRITVYPGETNGVSQVEVSNVVADCAPSNGSEGAILSDQSNAGMVRDIHLAGFNLDLTNQTGTNSGLTVTNVVNSTFSDIRIKNARGKVININGGTDLQFARCDLGQQPGAPASTGFTVDGGTRIRAVGVLVNAPTQHGFATASTNSAATDITFSGCTVVNPAVRGFQLTNAGVRLTDCQVLGGQVGIYCGTTTVPSGVVVIGGKFTGQSTAAIQNIPAGTRIVAATGLSDQ